ncbi:MAG TPA: hypothetical protein VFQ61_27115 [Polyangiaceae bacterium]|nr:hypothetical protein [Polyangiaceae bacterium]
MNYCTSRRESRVTAYVVLLVAAGAACSRGSSVRGDGLGGTGGASCSTPDAGQGSRHSGGRETEFSASGSSGELAADGGAKALISDSSAGEANPETNSAGEDNGAGNGGARGDVDNEVGGSAGASGGGAGAAGTPTEPESRPWKLVFITPDAFPSDFGRDGSERGVGAHVRADALCQQAAIDAGLRGQFRAWLSTSTSAAINYFAILDMNGPWYRADDELVAEDLSALVSKNGLRAPILYTPNKVPGGMFWTGTGPLGTLARNCDDFTNANLNDGLAGHCALATGQEYGWPNTAFIACGSTNRALACFER